MINLYSHISIGVLIKALHLMKILPKQKKKYKFIKSIRIYEDENNQILLYI